MSEPLASPFAESPTASSIASSSQSPFRDRDGFGLIETDPFNLEVDMCNDVERFGVPALTLDALLRVWRVLLAVSSAITCAWRLVIGRSGERGTVGESGGESAFRRFLDVGDVTLPLGSHRGSFSGESSCVSTEGREGDWR